MHINNCPVSGLYFDSPHTRALWFFQVDFLLQLACSSLTPRSWFIEALRCINDLVHLELPIIPLPSWFS